MTTRIEVIAGGATLPATLDDTDITLYAPWGNLAIFYESFPAANGLVRLGAFEGPIDALLEGGASAVRVVRAD